MPDRVSIKLIVHLLLAVILCGCSSVVVNAGCAERRSCYACVRWGSKVAVYCHLFFVLAIGWTLEPSQFTDWLQVCLHPLTFHFQ